MKKKYPDDVRLTKLQMHRLVLRFKQTRSVIDSRQKNSGRSRSRRLDEIKSQNSRHIEHLT